MSDRMELKELIDKARDYALFLEQEDNGTYYNIASLFEKIVEILARLEERTR